MSGKSFVVPGASLGDSYVIPTAPDAEAALPDAIADVNAALADHDEREAALPPDAGLVSARNNLRREYDAAAKEWTARRAAHAADPDRKFLTKEGQDVIDTRFESELAADQAAFTARANAQLDVIRKSVEDKLYDANVVPAGPQDDGVALRFATTLSHTSPRHGEAMLADFVRQAVDRPVLAFDVIPLLRSMHDRGEWKGSFELARACETLQRVVESRPGVARMRADLALLDELSQAMSLTSICGLGQIAPAPIQSVLKHFRAEIDAHVLKGQCTSGICSTPAARAGEAQRVGIRP